jgi:DNA-binding transcriptional MerR regulator
VVAGAADARATAAKSPEAWRSIGEVAAELGVKTHVLRFWETRFDEVQPVKRADGRRFYRPQDVACLRRIRDLLRDEGMTIRGAQRALARERAAPAAGEPELRPEGVSPLTGASVRDLQNAVREAVARGDFRAPGAEGHPARERLERLMDDLSALKRRLDTVRSAG